MKKTITICFYTMAILFITLNLFSITNLSFLGFRIFKVGSGSMNPALRVNDLIIIKESDSYYEGDIVTFVEKDSYITHRIVKIDNQNITTKGDANNLEDDIITKDKIIGKLFYKFALLGFISNLFSSYISWIILFVIGLLITILIPDKK